MKALLKLNTRGAVSRVNQVKPVRSSLGVKMNNMRALARLFSEVNH